MISDAILSLAKKWQSLDNTPNHAEIIEAKITAKDTLWLQEAFGERVGFGTAGLRAEMGPGIARMNRGVVQQTSLGIANYLQSQSSNNSVVIGYDARHNSKQFAIDAAQVFAKAGIRVHLFDILCATPMLSFAVLHLGCSAGVMITASHNPAADNGYKVYWRDGAQIISPHDVNISKHIDAVAEIAVWKEMNLQNTSNITDIAHMVNIVDNATISQYFSSIQRLRVGRHTGATIVYSAMHGVGQYWVQRALEEAGHTMHTVPAQAEPNGDFPTVQFPNPEEPGALDLSMELANAIHADVVLANDPDADRLAVAIRTLQGDSWLRLTGDQVGLLLADYLLSEGKYTEQLMVACSLVSSSQLRDIAEYYKASYAETLTGFKWIAAEAITHEQNANHRFVMGFEEALGYCIGSVARDKDGVSAVLVFADLVSMLKSQSKTIWDALIAIYQRHGLALSMQKSLTKKGLQGQAEIANIMKTFRENPPSTIAGTTVLHLRDYQAQITQHFTTDANGNRQVNQTAITLPKSNVLAFDLADKSRVIVRPSGTEPKIKFYFEARTNIADSTEFSEKSAIVQARLQELWNAMSI